MVSNQGDNLLLVVDASRKAADVAYLSNKLTNLCFVELLTERAR